jgi:hypothetical protein
MRSSRAVVQGGIERNHVAVSWLAGGQGHIDDGICYCDPTDTHNAIGIGDSPQDFSVGGIEGGTGAEVATCVWDSVAVGDGRIDSLAIGYPEPHMIPPRWDHPRASESHPIG